MQSVQAALAIPTLSFPDPTPNPNQVWPNYDTYVDFSSTEVNLHTSGNDNVGMAGETCTACTGQFPRANGRKFLFGVTGNIIASPSPPPPPPRRTHRPARVQTTSRETSAPARGPKLAQAIHS